jgi:hypothetical protein
MARLLDKVALVTGRLRELEPVLHGLSLLRALASFSATCKMRGGLNLRSLLVPAHLIATLMSARSLIGPRSSTLS